MQPVPAPRKLLPALICSVNKSPFMRWNIFRFSFLFTLFLLTIFGCEEKENTPAAVEILSVTLNSGELSNGATEVPLDASFEFVFSRSIDPGAFERAWNLQPDVVLTFTYTQQSTRVQIEGDLMDSTNYSMSISTAPIGQSGEALTAPYEISFQTRSLGLIRSMPPCTEATSDCLREIQMVNEGEESAFSFYGSFPIYEPEAAWEEITSALIMVHGLNRNADDYFQYLMSTLQSEGLEKKVALIAPFFREEPRSGRSDIFWSGKSWREGQRSSDETNISSFSVIDRLIAQLSQTDRFPVLEDIIIVGQSSGGLFVHTYAASTPVEEEYPDLKFHFVVGESQYFYYPDGRRINESSGELYTPSSCSGYDIWPLGFRTIPPYLSSTSQQKVNQQFLDRDLTYLLGNGSGNDGSLNTSECRATLLGSSRYQRGENMISYLNKAFPNQHNHRKVVATGITHDGSRMYQTPAFRNLLQEFLD